MRRVLVAIVAALAAAPAGASAMQIDPAPEPVAPPAVDPPIDWHHSRAIGKPYAGRLVDGVQLPAEGRDFWTYDWGLRVSPNRPWRRWGTDRLVRTLLDVLGDYRAAHPDAPRVGIADLSRPHGGSFGKNFGGLGHSSHQTGLDADVLYPRLDGLERRAGSPALIDDQLAQDLVDRFLDAGADYVFTGPRLNLRGPRKVVVELAHHDDHMHVRIR
ncbi:MAG TPA: penicillin-insensitive murein endopeptidase [Solirubrobacteraceae bacterium]|nr:penicillin-insensitive murein endopeptidase [Solirubrobacteraceae bacterium]